MGNFKTFSKFTIALFTCLVIISKSIEANNTTSLSNQNGTYDLSCFRKVIPNHYEISIGPILNSSDMVRVSCWVEVQAEIGKSYCVPTKANQTGTIVKFNSRNCTLDLKSMTVTKSVDGRKIQLLKSITNSVKNSSASTKNLAVPQQYTLKLDESQVNIGDQILLHVKYEIELKREYSKEPWQGLYYYDPTQMNDTNKYGNYPLHARYMFPTIENSDPFHRPNFKISVARYAPNELVSVSNTDIFKTSKSLELGEGWVIDHFWESPPMRSSQVILFILGGFQNHTIYKPVNNNTEYRATRLWTLESAGYKNDTIYNTLFEVENFMNFFDKLFNGTEYPLRKIDLIQIPWEYEASFYGSRNLGILKSYSLSYSKGYTGEAQEDDYSNVFDAPEIALQWFDGITSPVNEYSEFSLTGQSLAHFVNKYVFNWGAAKLIDKKYYTVDIKSLLDMLEHIIPRNVLQYAICQIYLQKTVQNQTFPTSLWNAIQESLEFHNRTDLLPNDGENDTVKTAVILNTYMDKIKQYPTIRIIEVENRTDSIKLYQEYPLGGNQTTQTLWWVPVSISTGNGQGIIWVSPNDTINSTKIYRNSDVIDTKSGYLFVTPDLTDYFEVEYGKKLMMNILKQLRINHSIIPKDLIHKQFRLLWKTNEWDVLEMGLEMTKYLGNEMDEGIWDFAIGAMMRFNDRFVEQPNNFQVYFGSKVNEILKKIGLSPKLDENAKIASLRRTLLEVSYLYEVPLVVENGIDLMKQWMYNSTINPFYEKFRPEIRQAFYCAAVRHSPDKSVFNFLFEQLVNHNLSLNLSNEWIEAKPICRALTCLKDDDLFEMLLGNDSKFAKMKNKELQNCYQQYIPFEILWKRPLTMKQAVYNFWKNFDMKENQTFGINETEAVEFVIPWSYDKWTSFEFIQRAILEEHVKFGSRFALDGNNFSSSVSVIWMPNKIDEIFDEIYNQADKWFQENL